jgi:hypothetical protein
MNWSRLASAVVGLLISASCALGQASLSDMASRIDLSDADRAEITKQVDRYTAMIATGTPANVRDGREALTKPFEADKVTVPFRVEAGRQLVEALKPLTTSSNELVAVNTLRIAGEVATTNSMALLIDGLKDPRPPVRMGAAYALTRLFAQARRSAPAISAGDTASALKALEAFIAAERDARLIDTAISAMVLAAKAPGGSAAPDRMARAIVEKARGKGAEADTLTITSRAVREMRDVLIGSDGKAPPGTARAAAEVAGQLIVAIKAQLTTADKEALITAAGSAETTLTIASTTLAGPDIAAMKLALADKVRAADQDGLDKQAERVLAVLKSEPFNIK